MARNHFLLSLLVSTSLLVPAFAFAQEPKQDDKNASPPLSAEKKAGAATDTSGQISADTYRELALFGEVFETVRAKYVEPVSDKQLIEYAIKGLISNLDPHSEFMTAKDFDDMKVQTRGEFGGLGIEVTMQEGVVKVVSPIDDTPAFRAGVKAGDLITHLDRKPVVGLTLSDAVDKMRGKIGSPIELTIRREGMAEPLFLTIKRDIIKIQSVRSHIEGDNIGYIRISSFSQNTADGLKEAFAKIKKEKGDKVIGYILDLRNNPGGLLDQAIAVSDSFLENGEIVSTRGRNADAIKRDNALPGDMANGLPVIILINGGSASASEIVSGALQDHHRAVIMGTKSFGKGSVQTVMPTPGGGAMRLTTARYFTPSGRSIQSKGIEPDILVEPAKIEKLNDLDIREADLKGAISNPDGVAAPKETEAQNKKQEDDKAAAKKDSKAYDPNAELGGKDYQVARAIDLLHGLALMKAEK